MSRPLLTRRQLEFLALTARGLQQSEIATACYVAEVTVRNTIVEARSRLGARNTAQAVALAVSLELIVFNPDVAQFTVSVAAVH